MRAILLLVALSAASAQFAGTYNAVSCTSSNTCCCPVSPVVVTQSSPTTVDVKGTVDGGTGCMGQTSLSGDFTVQNATAASYTQQLGSTAITITMTLDSPNQLTISSSVGLCPVQLQRSGASETGMQAAPAQTQPGTQTQTASTNTLSQPTTGFPLPAFGQNGFAQPTIGTQQTAMTQQTGTATTAQFAPRGPFAGQFAAQQGQTDQMQGPFGHPAQQSQNAARGPLAHNGPLAHPMNAATNHQQPLMQTGQQTQMPTQVTYAPNMMYPYAQQQQLAYPTSFGYPMQTMTTSQPATMAAMYNPYAFQTGVAPQGMQMAGNGAQQIFG